MYGIGDGQVDLVKESLLELTHEFLMHSTAFFPPLALK